MYIVHPVTNEKIVIEDLDKSILDAEEGLQILGVVKNEEEVNKSYELYNNIYSQLLILKENKV